MSPEKSRPQRTRTDHLAGTGPASASLVTHESSRLDPHPALEPVVDGSVRDAPGRLDKVVFFVAASLALAFVAWGLVSTSSLSSASASGLDWVVTNTGWLFSLVASFFVIFVIWLAAGQYGNIPLGRDDEAPEFRTISWIAMMFSAGMGIGLMFYGVAEPLSHYLHHPPGTSAPSLSDAEQADRAINTAMATTLFHWTLHPWAIYAVVGLAVAYGVYRQGRGLTISAAFTSILGERAAKSPAGRVIDILAIFATLFGSAASLGLGTLQIASGLKILGWANEVSNAVLVGIIVVLTIGFILSAVSGVAKGIQWLSNINMVLALVLAVFVFVVGPTIFILDLLPSALGTYFQQLPEMAARTGAGGPEVSSWLSSWTIFYWAWWVSWTPFVGMFIARISRGRTIRQFVTGVLLVPSTVSLIWFAIFGGAALKAQQSGIDLTESGKAPAEGQLFDLLQTMPWPSITAFVVMTLVAIFFVSGADAASIVMGTLSERGTLTPRRGTVIFWGAATGAVAAVMLLIGGDTALTGLQNVTIIAALPFVLVMVGLALALVRDLRHDPLIVRRHYARTAVEQAVVAGVTEHGDGFSLTVEEAAPGEGVGEVIEARAQAAAEGDSEEEPSMDSVEEGVDTPEKLADTGEEISPEDR